MKLKYLLATSVVGLSAAAASAPAYAQSTGSVEFEEGTTIVVSGTREQDVGGVEIPQTPKAKQELNEEIIRRQRPGQTVNDIVNLVPGVSFQNNDPWGSSGGSFTIRGFADDAISQTLDGLPLNDSGNYALYTNQQVDPEVLESVSVNLGATDVDSPTASAVGGTINIRTREPSDIFKITSTMSFGDVIARGNDRSRPYMRGFVMVDTGDITGGGLKAFGSASYTRYDNAFNNYGVIEKQQYNGRIWQDLGSNGDFIAVAGHYNENRNNFAGSVSINSITDPESRFYSVDDNCTVDLPSPGGRDIDNNCGASFDRRYNPSNTGNIRGSSRFTLTDNLILTVDPSWQYVKANGGGDEELLEQRCYLNADGNCTTTPNGTTGYTGFFDNDANGRQYYFGRDLNGDGDTLDEVTGHDPSQTRTRRVGVIANLAYEINPNHLVRLAYTYDDADHRQTGQTSVALSNGEIRDVFPVNDPLFTVDGFQLNKRNRQSYAILHQVSGEYRGTFGDLTTVIGLRAPFFTRELNQYCYTLDAGGDLACFENQDPADFLAGNPDAVAPTERTYKYDDLLPNVGLVYDFGSASVFANYAKGLSVPGTDVLYNSLFFAATNPDAQPDPETTDSFDGGFRYQTGNIQAQIAGYYTIYSDRLATAYDPVLDETVFRNLGRVDKYGVDASVAFQPNRNLLFYLFGSINESEIKDDVQLGAGSFADTAGKNESGAPLWSVGGRTQYNLGPIEIGIQAKHTGKRYVNDINTAEVGGYTLVDADIRWVIGENPFGDDVALQLNVTNILDEVYVGGFGGGLTSTSPFVQIGPPRAASISLLFGF
ncbi:TonB-dependent receptor [Citromicrobium bathyomarinum]|uniref:TonB-dependent receptor n=1 Tax=Citromicrobium bathyomarinum TaxID=72174 RepID=UPI00315A6677